MAPRVLYLSDTLVAVDKPTGLIVHGDGTGQQTLTDLVRAELTSCPDARGAELDPSPDHPPQTATAEPAARGALPEPSELQALNRLDRETSGIVLFSRRKANQAAYDRLIAAHDIEKRYLAIVVGRVAWQERAFSEPIGRDRHDAHRMRVGRTGKPAVTHACVLAARQQRGRTLTLLDVRIETGRKHQIRVHLAHAGHPILGDDLYGRPDPHGLMLHACLLSFTDPLTGEHIRIESPAPARFTRIFPQLKGPVDR